MLEQANDFKDESDALYLLLRSLRENDFKRPTQFKEWTINDILGHLHFGNILADLSLNNEPKFHEAYSQMQKYRSGGEDPTKATEKMLTNS